MLFPRVLIWMLDLVILYNDARKIYTVKDALGIDRLTTETYDKDNLFVAFSLDFKLWNKKSE